MDIFEQYSNLNKNKGKGKKGEHSTVYNAEQAKKMFEPFSNIVDQLNTVIGENVEVMKKSIGEAPALATLSSALAFVIATWVIYVKQHSETTTEEFMDKFKELTIDAIKTIEKKE